MLQWFDDMSVGVRELDAHHQQLFALVNGLLASVEKKDFSEDGFWPSVSNLADYVLYHLATEEEYMDRFDCSHKAHFEAHDLLRVKMKDLLEGAERARHAGPEAVGDAVRAMAEFAGHWHVEHILTMDKGYTRCFHEHGLF